MHGNLLITQIKVLFLNPQSYPTLPPNVVAPKWSRALLWVRDHLLPYLGAREASTDVRWLTDLQQLNIWHRSA